MPAVQVTPALPWSPGGGGTIELAEPITFAELLAGKLKFIHSGSGTVAEYDVVEYDGDAALSFSGRNWYIIHNWEGESSSIELVWSGGEVQQGMPYLSGVQVLTAVHQFEVYADQACSVRPQLGEEYEDLYVKVNKTVDEGDDISYRDQEFDDYGSFDVIVNPEHPAYRLWLWVAFLSEEYDNLIAAGSIVGVHIDGAVELVDPIKVSFGPIVYV